MAKSSTSSGFSDMSGGRGQYCCVPECGVHGMISLGREHI